MIHFQAADILNEALDQALGSHTIVTQDLSNIVEAQTEIFDANAVDPVTKALINRIGKEVWVSRIAPNLAPSIMMEQWEYGSVRMKVREKALPRATVNETWELQNGASYDPNVFTGTELSVHYANKYFTLEYDRSIAERQLKQSLTSANSWNSFLGMLAAGIENAFKLTLHDVTMAGYQSMIGDTIDNADPNTAVNLLAGFKTDIDPSSTLTADTCIFDPDFLRYAAFRISEYATRLREPSVLYNMDGAERWVDQDQLKVVMLAMFSAAAGVYLYNGANQFLVDKMQLPQAETVDHWQGSGTDHSFEAISSINVKTANNNTVEQSGILCVMHHREALCLCNYDRRTTSNYNGKAEFTNYFHKMDGEILQDGSENFVVFYVADET